MSQKLGLFSSGEPPPRGPCSCCLPRFKSAGSPKLLLFTFGLDFESARLGCWKKQKSGTRCTQRFCTTVVRKLSSIQGKADAETAVFRALSCLFVGVFFAEFFLISPGVIAHFALNNRRNAVSSCGFVPPLSLVRGHFHGLLCSQSASVSRVTSRDVCSFARTAAHHF